MITGQKTNKKFQITNEFRKRFKTNMLINLSQTIPLFKTYERQAWNANNGGLRRRNL